MCTTYNYTHPAVVVGLMTHSGLCLPEVGRVLESTCFVGQGLVRERPGSRLPTTCDKGDEVGVYLLRLCVSEYR